MAALGFGSFSILALGGYGLFEQGRYQYEAQDKATDYAEHAARQIRQACLRVSPPEKAQCVANEQAEYDLKTRDNRREQDDLVAQRKSALWTFIMGMAALIGMALSAIGVILVKQTFDETRRTNRIAIGENARATRRAVAHAVATEAALALQRQAFEAGTRPWLTFKNLRVHKLVMVRPEEGKEGEDWWVTPVIEVEVFNSGTTPAKNIRILTHAVDEPISQASEGQVEEWAKTQLRTCRGFNMGVLPPNGIGIYKSSIPCPVPYHDEHGAERRDVFPGIALAVIYQGMTANTIRQTVQMFRLSNVDPKMHQDTPTAHGFWLAHNTYGEHAITILAGSRVDRAT